MYQHIIWDFDGTLFESYSAMATGMQKALWDDGVTAPLEEILGRLKVTVGHAIDYYQENYPLSQGFKERFLAYQREDEARTCRPFEGVKEVCEAIAREGKHNYLFTHRDHTAIEFLQKYGMESYFTECITSERGFARKPSPQAVQYLLETYGISPENALIVGDRKLDLLSGRRAGIRTCLFLQEPQPGRSIEADHTVSNIRDLYGIVGIIPEEIELPPLPIEEEEPS